MSSGNVARVVAALVVAAVLATSGVASQQAEPSEESPQKRLYAVLFAKGPGYVEEIGTHGQPGMKEHVEFIMGLHTNGVVPLAGPLFDDDDEREHVSGVLYFVKAGSVQEARGIAMREPMVKTQVVEIVWVREFLVGVGRLD